jgi:hypothetical protein
MYENITDPKPCIDAIEGALGGSHATQAAHLYEENTNLDNYNPYAVQEIIDYLTDRFSDDRDAGYIVEYGEAVLKRMDAEYDESEVYG